MKEITYIVMYNPNVIEEVVIVNSLRIDHQKIRIAAAHY